MASSRASCGAVVSAPPAKRVKRSSSWAAASVLNAQKQVAICIRGTGVTGAPGATGSLESACPEYVPALVAIAFAPSCVSRPAAQGSPRAMDNSIREGCEVRSSMSIPGTRALPAVAQQPVRLPLDAAVRPATTIPRARTTTEDCERREDGQANRLPPLPPLARDLAESRSGPAVRASTSSCRRVIGQRLGQLARAHLPPAAIAVGPPDDTIPRGLRGSFASLLIFEGLNVLDVAPELATSRARAWTSMAAS